MDTVKKDHVTAALQARALAMIEERGLKFFSSLPAAVGAARSTLYAHGLHLDTDIRDALQCNRDYACDSLVDRWIESDNATLQIAAYKILAREDDRQKLTTQQIKADANGVSTSHIQIMFTDRSDD